MSCKQEDHFARVLSALTWLIGYLEGKGEQVPSWISLVRSAALEHARREAPDEP